ncbi:MAG: Trp family transcriptional regulator [Patescibacteria group bacterium]|mgnify:FL=1
MKKKMTDLTEQERINTLDMLYTAAASAKGRDGMKAFLRDLLTPSERVMLGRRIWIARLLMQGMSHAEISR